MLNTYVKNRGLTQTIIHDNNRNSYNEINWDADYNGELANISLISNNNGNKEFYNISLDNDDLVKILSIPSTNMPLEKRLKMDFNKNYQHDYNSDTYNIKSLELEKPQKISSYLSSPLPEEELIVPITVINKTPIYKKKNHKTYRVYKKLKSHGNKSRSSSKYRTVSSTIKPKLYSNKNSNKTFTIFNSI
jgi:hypothetical protein